MVEWLHPAMLWLGGLAVPLVALYILKTRRRRQRVPAVWLWEEAQKDLEARVPLRRLRRDWLLLLQLLILLLLVLAAAGPHRREILGRGGDVAVVVDASASMLARGRPEALRTTLRRLVDGLGANDRMTIVRAGPRPEVMAPLSAKRRALLDAAEATVPASAPADLAPAVELAETLLGEQGTVIVVTDAGGLVPDADSERRRVVRLGPSPPPNVGIVALGARPSDSSGRDHQIFVRLVNAGAVAASGTLVLTADGEVRDAAELELAAGSATGHTLRLLDAELDAEGTVLEVTWKGKQDDALAADDRAWWVLRPPEPRRYRLRGDVDPYLRCILTVIETDDDGWREVRPGERTDLEILVGHTPREDGPPFLWIAPSAGRGDDSVPAAAVLSWDRTHPALRFVDLRAVRIGESYRYERPVGARVLAESTAGPFILEGSRGGRRYLMWAFDPLRTDLPERVAYPLLVRHALEHLTPPRAGLEGGRSTGVQEALPWTDAAQNEPEATGAPVLIAPSGREVGVHVAGGQLHLPPLEEVGVFTLRSAGGEARFAVSLVNAAESDLTGASAARTAGAGAGAGVARERGGDLPRETLRGLWRPAVFVALILLCLEAAAFHRRWML